MQNISRELKKYVLLQMFLNSLLIHNTQQMKQLAHLSTALLLSLSGVILLFTGVIIPPAGIIDTSVLIAFGEISTFAGGLFGIDYHYRYK